MNPYCPDCETELDQATGICPACRSAPSLEATRSNTLPKDDISYTERYGGTEAQPQPLDAMPTSGDSRDRVVVAVELLAGAGVYGVIVSVIVSVHG